MRARNLIALAALVLSSALAPAQRTTPTGLSAGAHWGLLPGDRCPLTIYLDAKGRVYDSRFAGRYRVSQSALENDVVGGCKEQGRTSSVRIQAARDVSYSKVAAMLQKIKGLRPDIPVMIVDPGSTQR